VTSETAKGLALSLGILCLGLAAGVVYLLQGRSAGMPDLETALADPSVRAEIVSELIDQSQGVFDSFHDPMVGRVLVPGLEGRMVRVVAVSTNSYGMREREYVLPKPPGTVRVVLLGDSYVFGSGVEAEERLGVALEGSLREYSNYSGVIEVLHLGVPSWNLVSECTWLGRQLHAMQPDLVIQVAVPNDLDDVSGVRGFGTQARFSPQKRWRASGMVNRRHAASMLAVNTRGYVSNGIDHEGRERYREASEHVVRLARQVTAGGGRYVLLMNWMAVQDAAAPWFRGALDAEQLLWMPFSFFRDPAFRISELDGHWNAAGHLQVAEVIYAAIQERGLLPGLSLPPSGLASRTLAEWEAEALREVETSSDPLDGRQISSTLQFDQLDHSSAAQIHGGVFPGGGVAPFASFVLARGSARQLVLEGFCLPDARLDGLPVRISVDEFLLATARLQAGAGFRLAEPLPEGTRGRPYLTIRIEAPDWVYRGEAVDLAVSLGLRRAALE